MDRRDTSRARKHDRAREVQHLACVVRDGYLKRLRQTMEAATPIYIAFKYAGHTTTASYDERVT